MVVAPFAVYQVGTKAGYSGWWTVVPLSPWLVGFAMAVFNRSVVSSLDGHLSLNGALTDLRVDAVLEVLIVLFVMVMFVVFAFSDWPVLARARH